MNTIYRFYPKNILFSDKRYRKSKQHKGLLARRKNAISDVKFKKYLHSELENIFVDYVVSDFIDLDNDVSYCYRVLMHKNQSILDDGVILMNALGGLKYELILVLSYLANYCYYYILETRFDSYSKQWSFNDKFKDKNFIEIENRFLGLDVIKNLDIFLSKNNYRFVTDDYINLPIKDIETELHGFGEVKIYDALFSDLLSILDKQTHRDFHKQDGNKDGGFKQNFGNKK